MSCIISASVLQAEIIAKLKKHPRKTKCAMIDEVPSRRSNMMAVTAPHTRAGWAECTVLVTALRGRAHTV